MASPGGSSVALNVSVSPSRSVAVTCRDTASPSVPVCRPISVNTGALLGCPTVLKTSLVSMALATSNTMEASLVITVPSSTSERTRIEKPTCPSPLPVSSLTGRKPAWTSSGRYSVSGSIVWKLNAAVPVAGSNCVSMSRNQVLSISGRQSAMVSRAA